MATLSNLCVWEVPLRTESGEMTIQAPRGSEFLHVEEKDGLPYLWMMGDLSQPRASRTLILAPNGGMLPAYVGAYIGTARLTDTLFLNIFEAKR
jgi:hypothetical protein